MAAGPAIAGLALLVVTVLAWWRVLFLKQYSFGIETDFLRQFYPARVYEVKALASGSFPLWNPYVLSGQREEEHWRFVELAVSPGDHPCLAATPRRNLDEATAEQIGDYFVFEWRGKRREILYRPE